MSNNFLIGITSYSKGNVYFCDTRLKRIFKWSVETNSGSLLIPAVKRPHL